ncbi:hypothetical protein NPIL_313291, partial [Nephila pilipes]
TCEIGDEEYKIQDNCQRNCKVNCKKLIYRYKTVKRVVESYEDIPAEIYGNEIMIFLKSKNREVIVISHKPLYNGMDVFSYIGGLMGCWLGISVWAWTGIAETTFWIAFHYLKQFSKKLRDSHPARNQFLFRRNIHSSRVL